MKRLLTLFCLTLLGLMSSIAPAQGVGNLQIRAFNDENLNGLWDLGELPFSGIPLQITTSEGPRDGQTNLDGFFNVANVPVGTVHVRPLVGYPRELTIPHDRGDYLAQVQAGTPTVLNIGIHERCTDISVQSVIWNVPPNPATPITTATVTMCVTNNSSFPMHWMFPVQSPPYTLSPVPTPIFPPILPGQTGCFPVTLTTPPGPAPSELCFVAEFHNQDLSKCCADKFCFEVPTKDCYQMIRQEVVCGPNGTFTVNFTLQSLYPNVAVNGIRIVPSSPSNMIISPAVIPVSPSLAYGQTFSGSFTISNATQGSTVYFFLALYNGGTQCCTKRICIQLPVCDECEAMPGVCTGLKPRYVRNGQTKPDWVLLANQSVAALTCYAQLEDDPVVGIFNTWNYACASPQYPVNQNLYSPTPPGVSAAGIEFSNLSDAVPNRWIKRNLGNTFGICFDNQGNIYVAQTSCYNEDRAPIGGPGANGHGQIYKLANGSGAISVFNASNLVVSLPDPNIVNIPVSGSASDERYPEIGDVCFNGTHNVLYATGMDEGAIYTYNTSGTLLNKFDPMGPTAGTSNTPGFAPYGELLWAVEFHAGRVFYSVWQEDMDNPSSTLRNTIRSVQVDAAGIPIPGTDRRELLDIPPVANWRPCSTNTGTISTADWSSPVSDISFDKRGRILLAERSMGTRFGFYCNGTNWLVLSYGFMWGHASGANAAMTSSYPHYSRVMEFFCEGGKWRPSTAIFNVGSNASGTSLSGQTGLNSSGGIDYDFVDCCPNGSTPQARVWSTADYMFTGGNYWYGLQGLPTTGGSLSNSMIIDLDGVSSTLAKSTTGDVEIPCPTPCTAGRISGNLTLQRWIPGMANHPMDWIVEGNGGSQTGVTFLDAMGNYQIEVDLANGTYALYLKTYAHLTKRVMVTVNGGIATATPFVLLTADANCDNEVDAADIDEMIARFGSASGSSNWEINADADGSREIDAADIDLAIQNFGAVGD